MSSSPTMPKLQRGISEESKSTNASRPRLWSFPDPLEDTIIGANRLCFGKPEVRGCDPWRKLYVSKFGSSAVPSE